MKLTEEQIKDFIRWGGDRLPNPDNYPRCFQYQLMLYMYTKKIGPFNGK